MHVSKSVSERLCEHSRKHMLASAARHRNNKHTRVRKRIGRVSAMSEVGKVDRSGRWDCDTTERLT